MSKESVSNALYKVTGIALNLALAACGTRAVAHPTISPDSTPQSPTSTEVVPTATGTPTPSETPTLTPTITLTPYPREVIDQQMTKIAPLTTPGAVDVAVVATSEAFTTEGWKNAVEHGFPMIAINSSFEVGFLTGDFGGIGGSGNLTHVDGYWVVLTAGHLLQGDERTNALKGNQILGLELSRKISLPSPSYILLSPSEFGLASAGNSGIDIGVIVTPDKNIDQSYSAFALTRQQLYFGEHPLDSVYAGLCFPGITAGYPTLISDAGLTPYMNPLYSKSTFIIDRSLISRGCSGGGIFVKKDGEFLYAGAIKGSSPTNSLVADTTLVTNLGSLGEEGLNKLIASAIADYESKNP
jgi:hypothetical protein